MSTKITYNGRTTELADGYIATLPCKDYKMETDVVVEAPEPAEISDSPLPIEVSTEAEMTALLTSGEVGGVYKYTGTTGTYENGALYVLENALITFTIDGTSYEAEDGMTWYEWCNSEYNTDSVFSCTSSSAYVTGTSGRNIRTSTGSTLIIGSDTIVSGTAYIYIFSSGGGV